MNKIPTLYQRERGKVIDQLHPTAGWILSEWRSWRALEKLDGMNVRLTIRSGTLVRVEKRRNPNKEQKALGIIDAWYKDATEDASDQYLMLAAKSTDVSSWPEGEHSCEALGPRIQGNPLGLSSYRCVPFNRPLVVPSYPISISQINFESMKVLMANLESKYSPGHPAEGLVFHHSDGHRAKLKRKDFGFK